MSVTPSDGVRCIPLSSRQQHPAISLHDFDASSGIVWSGSPRIPTSHPSLRIVAGGVADVCGPIATFTAFPPISANHSFGTLTSGGGQRQNRYDGAVGITRKSGANASTF